MARSEDCALLTRLTPLMLIGLLTAGSGFAQPDGTTDSPPPNVVLILVDDAGFMDFGGYGGEAKTPHIDSLANAGVRFSNYHTSPLCAPSRAMLLTGLDNHRTGVATIPEVLLPEQEEMPGYSMRLEPGVETVAERLRESGYRTYMTGKWHLGSGPNDLPDRHGFDRSFALDASGADNWEQKSYMPYYDTAPWFEDGEPATLPEGFYSSKFLIDRMIDYLAVEPDDGRPFFAYIAFQAVHIPIQAPRQYTDHYEGIYDAGWQAIREARWQRARDSGLIDKGARLAPPHPALRQWETLTHSERRIYARAMAVNAGMLEAMDHHIGRLIAYLRGRRQFENTIFIIASDNGPEFNDPVHQRIMEVWMRLNDYTYELETLGEKGSLAFIGPEWANAAATPGKLFKFYASEGGTRVPLIVSGPGVSGLASDSGWMDALTFVSDITPTILDFAGTRDSATGRSMDGRSLRQLLSGSASAVYSPEDAVGMEVSGNAALFKADHKLVRNMLPHGDAQWRLYDIKHDPGETEDLSAEQPERVRELLADYHAYEQRVGVLAVPEDFDPLAQIARNTVKKQLKYNGWKLLLMFVLLAGLTALVVRFMRGRRSV